MQAFRTQRLFVCNAFLLTRDRGKVLEQTGGGQMSVRGTKKEQLFSLLGILGSE